MKGYESFRLTFPSSKLNDCQSYTQKALWHNFLLAIRSHETEGPKSGDMVLGGKYVTIAHSKLVLPIAMYRVPPSN